MNDYVAIAATLTNAPADDDDAPPQCSESNNGNTAPNAPPQYTESNNENMALHTSAHSPEHANNLHPDPTAFAVGSRPNNTCTVHARDQTANTRAQRAQHGRYSAAMVLPKPLPLSRLSTLARSPQKVLTIGSRTSPRALLHACLLP